MTRFLVDEDMPRSLARELRAAGIDAVDVRDLGLRGHADAEVFGYAVRDKRALITSDVEFGNILRFPLGGHAGIVVARFQNEVLPRDMNAALLAAIALLTDGDVAGNVVTVTPGRIRIRRAP